MSQKGGTGASTGGHQPSASATFPKFVATSGSNMMRASAYSQRGGSKFNGSQSSRLGAPVTSSIGGGANKSSMIEQEMKAIRKIKEK